MKNFVQEGERLTVAAPSALTSGQPFMVGSTLFGVASGAAAQGDDVVMMTEGVFDLPKVSAQAWSAGDRVYWDAGASKLTNVNAGDPLAGIAVAAAANPSATGRVLLGDAVHIVRPTVLCGRLADVSTAASTFVVAPHAGTITGLKTVLEGAITVADAAVALKLGGVAVTNGAVTVAHAGSAAGDVDTATPTAANVVAAGDAIEVASDGASTTVAGLVVQIEVTP
ncbi:MAG: DUF2190 family protein [Alphaproteobacteria bacterium]